ncbi:RNA polymerase sigma factor [Sphingomonas lenta]|uniref:RNA polymerase sigma-70 region 2 domain-containing protein n=1 Tax=Sphingomonas lenta TaxID=1141887 RepID=A0A2A2SIB4_9SPHN|nr:sigma factor [Sphingomonas lenta]PAX09017.1 hypothetical protein CKY28_06700 [Sphingomonas lenta]
MTNDELLTLHGRLVGGELQVASRIVERVLPRLVATVRSTVPELHDRQDAEEASLEALLRYLEAPQRYQPGKAQLTTWLAHVARQYALNLKRGQARRHGHESDAAATFAAQREVDDLRPAEERMLQDLEWSNLRDRFHARLFKDEGDRDVFALMSKGEVDPALHARMLGLPDDESGWNEAATRVERMRGRIRRIGRENAS